MPAPAAGIASVLALAYPCANDSSGASTGATGRRDVREDAINATGKQLLIKKPVTRRARDPVARPDPAAGPRAPWLV